MSSIPKRQKKTLPTFFCFSFNLFYKNKLKNIIYILQHINIIIYTLGIFCHLSTNKVKSGLFENIDVIYLCQHFLSSISFSFSPSIFSMVIFSPGLWPCQLFLDICQLGLNTVTYFLFHKIHF